MNSAAFTESFLFRKLIFKRSHSHDQRQKSIDHHYLAYMESGYGRLVSAEGDQMIELAPGDVFYIPKGMRYQSFWQAEEQIVFHSYGFRLLPSPDQKKYFMQKIKLSPALTAQVRSIPIISPINSEAVGALYTTLAAILPLMESAPLGAEAILCDKATQYMTKHPNVTVSDIARHCGVSESAIYNAFRHVLGITPNTQRQILLCDRAIELLTTTDRPIEEISDTLGFSSSSYFRKVFFARTGQTPSEVRKKVFF